MREPSPAPRPATGNGIQDPGDKQLAKKERPKGDPFANRADDDVPGRLHEHDFKECEAIAAGIVRRADQKKSLASQKSPEAAADEKMIQRGNAAEIPGSGVHGYRAELKSVADRVVREERKNVRGEIQHHQVAGIFLAHQSTRQERKTGLHEEHQVSGEERPREVRRDAGVAHSVGQLQGQRFLGGLRLKIVVVFFALCVIRRRLVRRLRHDKGIARRIGDRRAIARRRARRIGLRLLRKREANRAAQDLREDQRQDRPCYPLCGASNGCVSHRGAPLLIEIMAAFRSPFVNKHSDCPGTAFPGAYADHVIQ